MRSWREVVLCWYVRGARPDFSTASPNFLMWRSLMNANPARRFRRLIFIALGSVLNFATFLAPGFVSAGRSTAPVWKIVIGTAPGLEQDVWVTGMGNKLDGWISAGVLCIGPLAQGFGPTQHATLDADIVAAGIFGIDGTPVPPGTYTLPGGTVSTSGPTGPAQLWPPRDFTLTPGKTFFII